VLFYSFLGIKIARSIRPHLAVCSLLAGEMRRRQMARKGTLALSLGGWASKMRTPFPSERASTPAVQRFSILPSAAGVFFFPMQEQKANIPVCPHE
jgi:hypothetical protein